jgi:signal peptidase I
VAGRWIDRQEFEIMTIVRWFISQTVRNACAARKHYRRLLAAHRDLMSAEGIGAVELKLRELSAAIVGGNSGEINIKGEELQFAAEKWIKPYPNAVWRENVEVLLVALAVAMAIRTFFLQPFKIPTGSMQPTLFGVTAKPDYWPMWDALRKGDADQARAALNASQKEAKDMVIPTGWDRVKEWIKGNSYLHFVAPADGKLDAVGPVHHFLIFNTYQTITFAGKQYTIWLPPDYGEAPGNVDPLVYRAGLLGGREYHQGEDVIKLRMTAGDHLFVDRLTYNFRKPSRGDIIVFATSGIPEDKRESYNIPGNEYYIKRLVGLPGEKISIGDDRHLVIDGHRLDASTPHFENVYGFDTNQPPRDSQWSGHVNGTVAQEYHITSLGMVPYFPDAQSVVEVPAGQCMPMGDNTCNSLDSRFWGPIPENDLLGKSFFVYWPITSRFGLDNH